MPRPQPDILDADLLRKGSPRYRFQRLPLRTAVNQLEQLTIKFGDDVIGRLRDSFDVAQANAALSHRQAVEAWEEAGDPSRPKPRPVSLGVDFYSSILSVLQGGLGALTGSLMSNLYTDHFLAGEVEVEVGDQWVRLVQARTAPASGLDCSGIDYDLPPEDAFPLWWKLAEVNLLPLCQPAIERAKQWIAARSKDVDSSKPSSAPAVTDSPTG
jgi:hypothetical protein